MTIFANNISYDATEDSVRELFEPFGQIVHLHMARDRETKKFRGFCFVEYAKDEDATQVLLELNRTKFLGRTLYVREADKDRR